MILKRLAWRSAKGALALSAVLWVGPAWADAVRIALASNLAPVFTPLVAVVQQQAGITLQLSLASSGQHYAQLQQGAPFDIWIAADADYAQRWHRQRPDTALLPLAQATLVWASTQPLPSLRPAPLTGRLAIANPQVAPFGRAAWACLQHKTLSPIQLDRRRLITAPTVLAAAHYLRSGAVAHALLSQSQLSLFDSLYWQALPADCHEPLVQMAVKLTDSPAVAWVWRYLHSDDLQQRLAALGYQPLVAQPSRRP